MTDRFINTVTEPSSLRRALGSWLAAELLHLQASRAGTIRLITPWLSDVPVASVGPSWLGVAPSSVRPVRTVLDLLGAYARQGGDVAILIREVPGDRTTRRTADILGHWDARRHPRVTIKSSTAEHAKIWVGQRLAFFGSSNMTEGGLGVNKELMEVTDNQDRIARLASEADVFLGSSKVR